MSGKPHGKLAQSWGCPPEARALLCNTPACTPYIIPSPPTPPPPLHQAAASVLGEQPASEPACRQRAHSPTDSAPKARAGCARGRESASPTVQGGSHFREGLWEAPGGLGGRGESDCCRVRAEGRGGGTRPLAANLQHQLLQEAVTMVHSPRHLPPGQCGGGGGGAGSPERPGDRDQPRSERAAAARPRPRATGQDEGDEGGRAQPGLGVRGCWTCAATVMSSFSTRLESGSLKGHKPNLPPAPHVLTGLSG